MSEFNSEGDTLDVLPATVLSAGTLYQYGGKAGLANADSAAGEAGCIRIRGIILVPNPDAVNFTNGADVGYVQADDKVIVGGTGDFDIGSAVGAGTDNPRRVLLNGGQL